MIDILVCFESNELFLIVCTKKICPGKLKMIKIKYLIDSLATNCEFTSSIL